MTADVEDALARAEAAFATGQRTPFDFQRRAWRAYLEGRSGLINAATGTGKTLAAAVGPLVETPRAPAGLRLLWITPLRALANDLAINLQAACELLQTNWRVGIRTGDTSASQRRQQRTNPPQILVLTPESLSVLLSDEATEAPLASLRAIVVDEWHELLGTKRGVQLELCLAHVRALAPGLRTWGLSATLPNLEQACEALVGNGASGELIRSDIVKPLVLESVLPPDVSRFPWAGHLGVRLLAPVIDAIEQSRTTLLFTNTRSQAELWYQAIANARRDWLTSV
ncbi:MAG: DEAD/DEAH box helicase, partial [Steroidobacteraceae bacterium]